MNSTQSVTYYRSVGEFYDANCSNYEQHYWRNGTLQKIRQAFREKLKKQVLRNKTILEIGTGPGIDVAHFAKTFPESILYGIDVSQTMIKYAEEKMSKLQTDNVTLKHGSIEDLHRLFPDIEFDLIYVFFGALNTVENLEHSLNLLNQRLRPNGKMVLTFVNKYYLAEIVIMLLKLKPKAAFARLRKVWPGYSKLRTIDSYCYTPKYISTRLPKNTKITDRQGYSIISPAWYRHPWNLRIGKRASQWLWKMDKVLNHTFAWKLGEYTLFVVEKKPA